MNWKRLQIAKQKARKTFRKHQGYSPEHIPEIDLQMYEHGIEPLLGIYRKTKVFCSNPCCCGNSRRLKGQIKGTLTRQELKAALDEDEQIKKPYPIKAAGLKGEVQWGR